MLKSSFFKHFFYKSFGIRKNETIFAVENYHHNITTNLNHTDTTRQTILARDGTGDNHTFKQSPNNTFSKNKKTDSHHFTINLKPRRRECSAALL